MAKGVEREVFQTLMNKAKHDVQVKRQFSPEQMRELALNYQKTIRGIGIGIVEDLYILQTRDMITIKKKENFDAFVESLEMTRAILGKGIGVSGSALAGRAVFTVEHKSTGCGTMTPARP